MKLCGLEIKTGEEVYPPREDTFLLAENLESELRGGKKVLEIGTGTGILSLIASKKAETVLGADISKKAVDLARKNAKANGIENVEFRYSDLFKEVEGEFDLIIFNPPYLPENEDRVPGEEQWSGGETGLETVEKFSKDCRKYLKDGGVILIVISSLTGLEETKELFEENGFRVKIKDKEKVSWETLYLLEIF